MDNTDDTAKPKAVASGTRALYNKTTASREHGKRVIPQELLLLNSPVQMLLEALIQRLGPKQLLVLQFSLMSMPMHSMPLVLPTQPHSLLKILTQISSFMLTPRPTMELFVTRTIDLS